MANWLLDAAELLALTLQRAVPARLRGLTSVQTTGLGAVKAGSAVQLVFPDHLLLRQRLDLPKGETAANPGWLAARIEALSPWERDAFLWDAQVSGGGVELALIPLRPVVEAEMALKLRAARLAEVVATGFCFRRDRAQTRRWRDRLALAVVLVTLLTLALAGLGLQMGLQAQDRAALAMAALARSDQRLKDGAGPAEAALALLPRKTASAALELSHLAAALPQDSFLTTLSVTTDGFELSGQTAAPEAIIPALSADAMFAGVDFAGPAARNAETGSYSFTIRGTWGQPCPCAKP